MVWAKLLAQYKDDKGTLAYLMHVAMVCSDDPVTSLDEVKLQGTGEAARLMGIQGAEFYLMLCGLIDVTSLPDSTDADVTVDAPTLLLSGDLDVATPSFRSQEVADALPNATHVIFPGRTHVQIGGINFCGAMVATQFMLDPTATLDLACVKDTPPMGFVLPDGSVSQ